MSFWSCSASYARKQLVLTVANFFSFVFHQAKSASGKDTNRSVECITSDIEPDSPDSIWRLSARFPLAET